jgi:hypothetical protein
MKKLYILTALLCSLLSFGQGFSSGGITYNITSSTVPRTVQTTFTFIGGAVNIPSTVTNAGISYSVTKIGSNTFYNCTNMTSINIPSTVSVIEYNAFSGCTGLTSVTVNWTTPLTILPNVFIYVNIANVGLNVPTGTVAAYQAAAVWQNFNPIVATLSNNNFETSANNVFYSNTDNKLKLMSNDITAIGNYNIFDISGKLLQKGEVKTSEVALNFDTKGIFIAVFDNDTWKQNLKFIK